MSCRHSLANTTCARCYPDCGGLDSNGRPQIDPGDEADYEPNMDGPGAVALSAQERAKVDAERMRRALVEMRRTAVNFADRHVYRCQLDGDCNHFATYERTGRDIAMFVCDNCIEQARRYDDRAASKGCGKRPPYKERDDAAAIRELTKASQAAGLLIDEPCPKCKHIGEHGDECQWL